MTQATSSLIDYPDAERVDLQSMPAGGFERESRNFHFNSLLKSMLAGYWEWDLMTNHFFASPSLKSLLGFAPRQVVALEGRCPEFIAPEEQRSWRQAVTRLLTDRKLNQLELEIACVHTHGTLHTMNLRMCVIERDTLGPPLRLAGCLMALPTSALPES